MKKELKHTDILDEIKKHNKKVNLMEKIGHGIFGILLFIFVVGGTFIYIHFDLHGPQNLSFLGKLWGLIGFLLSLFFLFYWQNKITPKTRRCGQYYEVLEDTVYDIRYRKKKMYVSFTNLKHIHSFHYFELPKKYKSANPGDRFFLVIDKKYGKLLFIGSDEEYNVSFRDRKIVINDMNDIEKLSGLYFEDVVDFYVSETSNKGVELNDENSTKKSFIQ